LLSVSHQTFFPLMIEEKVRVKGCSGTVLNLTSF